MKRRRRLLATARCTVVLGLLALIGWLTALNLDKHDRLPDELAMIPLPEAGDHTTDSDQADRPGGSDADGQPTGGLDGTDPTALDGKPMLAGEAALLADDEGLPGGPTDAAEVDDVDDWPGGRGPIPVDGPVTREVLVTSDGGAQVIGSAPSWEVVTDLVGVLSRRLGRAGSSISTSRVEWHPDASPRVTDGVVRLQEPILYEAGEIAIPSEGALALTPAVALVSARPDLYLVVVAHVDDVGGSDENAAVALARANGVVDELVARGIERSRVLTVVAPADPDTPPPADDATRQLNRRVEIRIEGLLVPASSG